MSYTLGDITDKVLQRIRDTGYSTSEVTNYINDTQNDVFNEYRLPFMETTQAYTLTVGVADITNGSNLPTNFVTPIDLLLTTNGYENTLVFRDVRDMDALYPDYESSSYPNNTPTDAYKYAQTIKVFPEPNIAHTVTLRYYKKPTLLSADADIPELPSQFEELLVVGAAYRIMQVKDNYDQAAILENKYKELLDKLVMQYSRNQVGRPTIMRINRVTLGKKNY